MSTFNRLCKKLLSYIEQELKDFDYDRDTFEIYILMNFLSITHFSIRQTEVNIRYIHKNWRTFDYIEFNFDMLFNRRWLQDRLTKFLQQKLSKKFLVLRFSDDRISLIPLKTKHYQSSILSILPQFRKSYVFDLDEDIIEEFLQRRKICRRN